MVSHIGELYSASNVFSEKSQSEIYASTSSSFPRFLVGWTQTQVTDDDTVGPNGRPGKRNTPNPTDGTISFRNTVLDSSLLQRVPIRSSFLWFN